jgi:hypothetical protein
MNVRVINSFQSVFINQHKKPIVICDIDNTFICSLQDYQFYYDIYKNEYNLTNEKYIHYNIKNMMATNIINGFVKQTDENGFKILLEKIKKQNGKFIFLTSRSSFSHPKTLNDLKFAKLDYPEQYEIHYTGDQITKANYIYNNNLLFGYNQYIFIDDIPMNIDLVKKNPHIECYLFDYMGVFNF